MKKKSRTTLSFVVTLKKPPDATVTNVKDYVWDAVCSFHGSYRPPGAYGDDDPGDPMFSLDESTVKVRPL